MWIVTQIQVTDHAKERRRPGFVACVPTLPSRGFGTLDLQSAAPCKIYPKGMLSANPPTSNWWNGLLHVVAFI
jgi:hypothetical protein